MSMKLKLVLLLPMLCLSCSKRDVSNTIFVSFDAVKELVSNIVGGKHDIETLTPPGTEAHDFELTASKLAELTECKRLFINGFHFESWSDSLPNDVKNKTNSLSDGITPLYINNRIDPHIWLNPLNAIKEMENVYSVMSNIDEENQEYYLSNLNSYRTEFTELDNELSQIAETFTQKNIVVSHAAYGYMCDRYGLNQIYINGIEADEEPNTKTISEIIDKVNKLGITTIFTEELISTAIAEKISQETGVKMEMLNTLENIDDGESYISLMRENFQKLERACK